jgi:hypothetical protein
MEYGFTCRETGGLFNVVGVVLWGLVDKGMYVFCKGSVKIFYDCVINCVYLWGEIEKSHEEESYRSTRSSGRVDRCTGLSKRSYPGE